MVAFRAEVPANEQGNGTAPELSAPARAAAMDTGISQEELHQYASSSDQAAQEPMLRSMHSAARHSRCMQILGHRLPQH